MTNEFEGIKTNEFLRRRKLRLQQVREQSKDIAKKIRQRAKVEKLRQVTELDSKKEQEYLKRQEKLVKRLELLYAKGVSSVGAGHKQAADLTHVSPEKPDLSKQRGREAAAELRKKKQALLDEQKKLLDRKLQAREAANEISREKSSNVANKILAKASSTTVNEQPEDKTPNNDEGAEKNAEKEAVKLTDMATQWDPDVMPNEWEPNVPVLSLPKDDSEKESFNINNTESKSDKSRRIDLFALSEEMPSSLRGGQTNIPEERVVVKPSFTQVSEYLQSRGLRLRDTDKVASKPNGDLQSLKQTIMRARPSKTEVKNKPREKSPISSMSATSGLAKKNSVMVYNHSTRDSRNVPYGDERLVFHDTHKNEDAYSQAIKETSVKDANEREHQHRLAEMRSKIAMTKQNVEKEYNDTLSFLNSLPKEKGSKTVKTAYMDERREKMLKDSRQHKLQQEFRKIEKECRKHGPMNCKRSSSENHRHRSQSPDNRNDFESRDFQYSWMPVPESDGSLAIHTIPNTKPKSANSVKFSKVDSYHEYRSRHKHTPPTKEKDQEKPKRVVETVLIQNGSESSDSSSDTSSVENLGLDSISKSKTKQQHDQELTDAERIIIYKVLESKKEKSKKQAKLISSIAKSLHSINKDKTHSEEANKVDKVQENRVSFEHIREGIYKTTKEKGDNIASLYFTDNAGEGQSITLTKDEVRYGKACHCNCNCSKLDKDQQHDAGTDNPRGKGDREPRNCEKNCCGACKCSCTLKPAERSVPPVPQPSAATSTSSFKTATNDKENPAFPEGGIVHLLDDEGQEAGKFYIGASGFLKDDHYEVIIQLRKKDSAKEEKKSENQAADKLCTIQEAQQTEEPTPDQVSQLNLDTKEEIPADVQSGNEPVDVIEESKQEIPDGTTKEEKRDTEKLIEELPLNNLEPERIISSSTVCQIDESQEKNCSDKCVCTSFQLSYAIPSHVTKSDPSASPKTATSAYTQTTFNSTNMRPAYNHMSSSTSTAYMSPPEVVLPRCLRRNLDDDTNKALNSEFGRFEKHYDDCTCGKCFSRKTGMEGCNSPSKKKSRCLKTNIPTPPNTSRSFTSTSEMPYDVMSNNIQKIKPRKCRKCECSVGSVKCHKSHRHKCNKNSTAKKRPVLPKHTISSVPSSSKFTWNLKKKDNTTSTNFNPVMKNYVNRLLTLNREGIKALEVANQECSTVATPGSSIIDVPRNMVKEKEYVQPKLSLEQIKNELINKILTDYVKKTQIGEVSGKTEQNHIHIQVSAPRLTKKRSVHKVKSLNISKRLLKNKKPTDDKKLSYNEESNDCSTLSQSGPRRLSVNISSSMNKEKVRSKSSPTPRQTDNLQHKQKSSASDIESTKYTKRPTRNDLQPKQQQQKPDRRHNIDKPFSMPQHRASSATLDSAPVSLKDIPVSTETQVPIAISTQTSRHVVSDPNYVKLAENKLENMEKIADLTEKCTQRLSNLAKVLEEVRKNKSLAYSQISTSDSASDVDLRSDKNFTNRNSEQSIDLVDVQGKLELKPSTPVLTSESEESETLDSSKYISFLTDIPKPLFSKTMQLEREVACENIESHATKTRTKPPPALSRMHLRHVQGITPHELSTVVEVDSPMSVRLKNQSSHTDIKGDSIDTNSNSNKEIEISPVTNQQDNKEKVSNPDLLQSNLTLSTTKLKQKKSTTDSSDESKMQMMDLKKFNEIMLQPFISIQEYAKQYDMGTIDEASNHGDVLKDDGVNEELSSMQSDSSLPDVIAELLKRKVITEPFKFDTVSNVHSTTGSSESSVLALSKVRKEKKKSTVMFQDKENVAESSDTLSFSSNPDLENAFKKLGMGWASSTLKKTKERLALSSSTNTSSSSVSQFKIKSFNNQDIPALVTDSVSSIMQLTKKDDKKDSKSNGQQTNMVKSMTVKEFLTNELADKITFTNKSRRNDTEEEFVSLFETKMPEEMKHSSQMIDEERTIDSAPGNRARTSTPVQIFKSMTYHSSSSSNMSNGLFSNADDLSSVKVTSNSIRNHSTSDKDDLTIPNCSLRVKKASDASKSD